MKQGLRIIIRDLVSGVKMLILNGLSGQTGCVHAVSDCVGQRGIARACAALAVLIGLCTSAKANYTVEMPIVLTQLPVGTEAERSGPVGGGMLRADSGETARLLVLRGDSGKRILSEGFHSACDPAVSFNGERIVFSGKRQAGDKWSIFEIGTDGANLRRITDGALDCRSPSYQSELYTIVSAEPWYQLTFVGYEEGVLNEYGEGAAGSLYSCKPDGSDVRRLTFNLSSDMDPFIQPDGRLLFAGWQRSGLKRGLLGRVSLFGVNIDGTDFAAFSTDEGRRIKHMPCVTTKGLVVFVENEKVGWDGAGTLGSVSFRRPLHSYRPLTEKSSGLFHSPWPLPDGNILVRPGPCRTGTFSSQKGRCLPGIRTA
ncbi:MAG: TolB family protein [Planctomycetota bacterium]|jgi:hypothetical protein